jgi:triacylglycerol lipase
MLAQLLRRLILGQMLLGATLGYWAATSQGWPLWTCLVAALLMPFAILSVITIATGLLSLAPQEPAAAWWRALVGELRAGIRIFLFRQPWTWAAPGLLPATSPANKVPVVLVHGYICNHRLWDTMADALRANGHAIYAVNLEPVFASIDRYAPLVEAAVQALQQHTGQARVALVGHSMGGLAIRAWLRSYGAQRATQVLTLGTPHAGTRIASRTPRSAHTQNGEQMVWGSAWLEELAASETPEVRQIFSIALTAQDNIVYPQRAQVIAGVTPTVFEGMGHLQMCLDAGVIRWVLSRLRSDSPCKH